MTNRPLFVSLLRWSARLLSLASIGFVGLFVFGMGVALAGRPPQEALLFLCFPVGVGVGLIVAWWRERWGGIISIGSIAAFYILNLVVAHQFPRGSWFLLLTFPGVLFLFSSYFSTLKEGLAPTESQHGSPRPRPTQ